MRDSSQYLGSASLILDEDGRWPADHRFYPYGETRRSDGASPINPTDRMFTGMARHDSIGVYHMGARWYDSHINRFLSPDSIVPDPANPQSLNRYSYTRGNPLRYRDPTGHFEEEWEEQFEQEHGRTPTEQDWWDYQFSLQMQNWISDFWERTYLLRSLLWGADVTLRADDVKWTITQAELVGEAVKRIRLRFGGDVRRFVGGVTVVLQSVVKPWFTYLYDPRGDYNAFQFGRKIYLEPDLTMPQVVHEMGHYWDSQNRLSRGYWKLVRSFMIIPSRTEDFAEAFRYYVLDMISWPPPGEWNCSSQGCAYPIDKERYMFFEQYRVRRH